MESDELQRGRDCYARRAWGETHEALTRADREAPLAPEDLELLATAAYMLGQDDEQLAALERAHQGYLDTGESLRAVRPAFWLGIHLVLRREIARAAGWFARAQRVLDRDGCDCVERGYLSLAVGYQQVLAGELETACATCAAAAEIGERFGDADLFSLAVMDEGRALVELGRVNEGLEKLDEAMVAATTGELSPIVTGLVYCGVIDGCHEAHELRRAREWTTALSRWCDEQRDLVPFTGTCLVHRAEIKQLHGAWGEALDEARLAAERFALRMNQGAAGEAAYRQGEVLRLQGEFAAAEQAYRDASRYGAEPQPGLALLRLAQGRKAAAIAAMRRVVGGTMGWVERARFLPAYVEIMLAVGDAEQARSASSELEGIAAGTASTALRAHAAQARGAVELAEGDASVALAVLRQAWQLWQELEAPYEGARVRVLMGQACRALGDDETAALELEAARTVFEELGAAPEVARADSLIRSGAPFETHGLTVRELQVLRLVAAGGSNRAIAAELALSTRTIDRHVSNIFSKLAVSSRAAATAFAYQNELV